MLRYLLGGEITLVTYIIQREGIKAYTNYLLSKTCKIQEPSKLDTSFIKNPGPQSLI